MIARYCSATASKPSVQDAAENFPMQDLQAAARFLRWLDPNAERWTFQTYDDRGQDQTLVRILHGTLDEHARALIELNNRGAAVAVTMNETDFKGTKRENIKKVRALAADLDGAALDPVLAYRLKPHAIVESSPGRFHCYYLIEDDFPPGEFEASQRGLAKVFNGDPAVALLTHRARLPGFLHMKKEPFLVRLKSRLPHVPFTTDDLQLQFPPEARPHKAESSCVILPANVPVECASRFVEHLFYKDGAVCLHYYRSSFYAWQGTHYRERDPDDIRAKLYAFLHKARVQTDKGLVPFNPTATKVTTILDALRAGVHLDSEREQPCWLTSANAPPPESLIACRNDLLDWDTHELLPHSPRFFNVNALPFDYDPRAPEPVRWKQFLKELWPQDQEARITLAEIFGLMLTADTSFQKIFMLVGPKRSGKGTIAHVLSALLGRANVVSPTMASLGTQFGLWPLIDKRLAIVPDARLGVETESRKSVEHLLSVSGEDTLTIDRKYQGHWTGRLSARFLILTNELPRFADASGALASRFVILTLTQSFYGREELDLKDKLRDELPGILNWALEGLASLRSRGYFAVPKSSEDTIRQMEDLASPVAAFVREKCILGMNRRIEKTKLYNAWKEYCEGGGEKPGSARIFGRNLTAASSNVRPAHSGSTKYYRGIELKDNDD